MDILGKEGEEAKQNVEKVSQQLESLESHLNAVDSALQDFMSTSGILGEKAMQFEEDELQELGEVEAKVDEVEKDEEDDVQELERKIETLQSQVQRMAQIQMKNKKRIQAIMDSELLEIIGRIRKLINTTNKRYYDLRDSLESMEQRLNELENEFVLEVNNREFDFERKVDQNDYEMRNQEIKNELSKLRTSVNVLADEMDKKSDIEVN